MTYRRTRRLSMRIVKNGDVHVSAPIGMPRKEVERFIVEHRDWIAEHVVHELCHLLEPSHNARFHALMDKYFPRWCEVRKETHRICRMSSC
ncbi:MAG: M48 family metallopeptidase [Prevotella sp.]|nr:M48 family metallopeptidase [Prevotella sp.]